MKLNLKKKVPAVLGAAAGGIATGFLNQQLNSGALANVVPANIRPAVPAIVGLALIGLTKNEALHAAGYVMIGQSAAQFTGNLTGGATPGGAYDYAFHGSYDNQQAVNGTRFNIGAANQGGQMYGDLQTTTNILGTEEQAAAAL